MELELEPELQEICREFEVKARGGAGTQGGAGT